MMNRIAHSPEYLSFRSVIPQKKICVDDDGKKEWTIYDMGSKKVKCPLICLPPVSARADVFFKQMLFLSDVGFRVISVEYPTYWNWKEFCEGFRRLLDHLHLQTVHLFGASLGGFLAQKFAEYTCDTRRVHSLILCNTFTDTSIFEQRMAASTFWMLPTVMLKSMVMGNLDSGAVEKDITESVDFITQSLESLGRKELASRLTMNCQEACVDAQRTCNLPITIINVNDDCAISQGVKDDIYVLYPNAKKAHLKSGGNFPYLSRAAEVNIFLQVHLRDFNSTPFSAQDVELEQETDIDAVLKEELSCKAERRIGAKDLVAQSQLYSEAQDNDEELRYHKQATALNASA